MSIFLSTEGFHRELLQSKLFPGDQVDTEHFIPSHVHVI